MATVEPGQHAAPAAALCHILSKRILVIGEVERALKYPLGAFDANLLASAGLE